MFNPVIIIYERSGDFGLVFSLVVISLNIPTLWWSFPAKIRKEMENVGESDLDRWRRWKRLLKINWIVFPIIFGTFSIEIVLTPGPALWVKVFGGFVAIALFILLIASGWALLTKSSK